jgi:hypothetical protein
VHLSLSVILYQNFKISQRKSLLSHSLRLRGRPAPPKSLRHKSLRQAVISPLTTGTVAVTSGA